MDGGPVNRPKIPGSVPADPVVVNIFGDDLWVSTDAVALLAGAGALPRLHRWRTLTRVGDLPRADINLLLPTEAAVALRALEAMGNEIPGCLAILPRGSADELARALDLGAGAAVQGPCPPRLLVAQVATLARLLRQESMNPSVFAASGWRFEQAARRLKGPGGRWMYVTPADARLLVVLFRHPESVISLDELAAALEGDAVSARSGIRTQISRLARRVAEQGGPPLLENIHGLGYRLSRASGPTPSG